ncbi:MAG: ABC transporter permease [Anaerolineales bacterium]|jgi:ABC-2 type transport system permease protein
MKTFRKILAVAGKELAVVVKDRGNMALMFLLPLLLSVMQSAANVTMVSEEGETSILLHVGLVNADAGEFGRRTASAVEEIDELEVQTFETLEKAEAEVAQGDLAAVIYFPAEFSQAIYDYEPTNVTVIVDPAQPESASIVAGIMNQVVDEVTIWGEVQHGIHAIFETSGLASEVSPEQRQGMEAMTLGVIMTRLGEMRQAPLITVISQDMEGMASDDWLSAFVAYIFSGYVVMFIFFIVPMAGESILQERETGTLRRLMAAPISGATIIGGKLLAYMLLPCLQAILLFGVASIFFEVSLGSSPTGLVVLTLVAAATAASFGLLIASFARSSSQASNLGVAAGFILAIVGGAVPIGAQAFTRSGGFISILARLAPQAHALEGYLKLIADGKNFTAILPEIGVLLGFTAVFLLVAARRFRYE